MIHTIITKQKYSDTVCTLKEEYDNLLDEGTFYVIYSTEYDSNGDVKHDVLDIISYAITCGYGYVNTIVYPTTDIQNVCFADNVRYVVWLCKNHQKMCFDKDVIREKHIWKDVEWGKRDKNYNPKGKDPGNVWIPTEDDGKAHITKHILLSDDMVIERLIRMSCCGDNYKLFLDELNPVSCASRSLPDNGHRKKLSHTVFFGSSEKMKALQNGSVQTAITSPPYWNLKDYYKEGQIGQEPYDVYLSRMKSVWAQCYKKLSNSGTLWININVRVHEGRAILIPKDIIEQCKCLGFYYKGIIIWHKSSGIPTGPLNIVDRFEYILIFAKSNDYYIDSNILATFTDYKNELINSGAFWNINRKAGSVGKKYIHPAIYPNDLVARIIQSTTKENDLVLDPFLGSGTSLIAAAQLHRSFVGYEYNDGFKELMDSRFSAEIPNIPVEYRYDE